MKRTVFLLPNGPKKPSLKIFYAYAFFKFIHVLLKINVQLRFFL